MAKSITFNAYESFEHIYTLSGAVFSANFYNSPVFDYFTNTAVVNDCIYFGNSNGYKKGTGQGPRNIRAYIGTAFAATSATFAWEYYNGSAWIAIPSLTDNTSGWTVTGEQTIDFVTPRDSAKTTINSVEAMWIRCRISAVSGITEGGANSTQNCRGGNSVIEAGGGTEVDKLTPENIYQADVAGGWGVVTKFAPFQSERTTYNIDACLCINSGYFYAHRLILNCSALYSYPSVVWDCLYMWLSFGVVWQWDTTFSGFKGHADSVISKSAINHNWLYTNFLGVIKESLLQHSSWFINGGNFYDNLLDCVFVFSGSPPTILDNNYFKTIKSQITLEANGAYITAQTPTILDGGAVNTYRGQLKLIDPVYLGSVTFHNAGEPPGGEDCWIREAFTITPIVTDKNNNPIQGAKVYVTDKDGTVVADYTTNASGLPDTPTTGIVRQWITIANTLTEYNPFRATITKLGKIKKDFSVTIDVKFDDNIVLYSTNVVGQEAI